ncbi:MAG TPA: hypothetical protein PLC88_09910, partial [Syntrophomonas sp.]|nr:hypothetical protein [Syntrophomonas sp.]
MKNNNGYYTKQVLQQRAEEINNYIDSNWGKLLLLEIFEENPLDLRENFLEGLGSLYSPQMASYFQLINEEYGLEYGVLCQRILNKYRLAGIKTADEATFDYSFYKAYVSCSRHTGRISLDVAWYKDQGNLYVECFFLTFNPDGIYSLFVVEDIAQSQYEKDHGLMADITEIDYSEACYLIAEAYKLNVRYMSRPALGKFIYQRYLDEPLELTADQVQNLNKRISARLAPRQLGNSLFHALRYKDYNYLLSILDTQLISGKLFYQFKEAINPGAFIMEGQVEEARASGEHAHLRAFSVILQEREVYKSEYKIALKRDPQGYWSIIDIKQVSHQLAAIICFKLSK